MAYAINPVDGGRAYYESVGLGQPLMLYHGLSGSSEDWRDYGYVDAFSSKYQVILIDARGHGNSDGSHDPKFYSHELHISDILAVLDSLDIDRTRFFGYSWGGWFGYGMLESAPDRLLSMVIGGMHPNKPDSEYVEVGAAAFGDGIANVLAGRERDSGERMPEPRRTRFLKQDAKSLMAALRGAKQFPDLNGHLAQTSLPCLVYAGADDPRFERVERAAASIPTAQFYSLSGVDHGAGMARIDLVQPLLADFLSGHHDNS